MITQEFADFLFQTNIERKEKRKTLTKEGTVGHNIETQEKMLDRWWNGDTEEQEYLEEDKGTNSNLMSTYFS